MDRGLCCDTNLRRSSAAASSGWKEGAVAFKYVDYEVVNRVARVTTNRPNQRNAQSRQLLEELDDAFALAAADRGVHVIVLFGSGEHFSGGHDLGNL